MKFLTIATLILLSSFGAFAANLRVQLEVTAESTKLENDIDEAFRSAFSKVPDVDLSSTSGEIFINIVALPTYGGGAVYSAVATEKATGKYLGSRLYTFVTMNALNSCTTDYVNKFNRDVLQPVRESVALR